MNVIIFGPPGAGKGTQSNNIVKKFNLYQISTGDLLRNEVKNQTELGKDIENIISKGDFATDEIVNELIKNVIFDPQIIGIIGTKTASTIDACALSCRTTRIVVICEERVACWCDRHEACWMLRRIGFEISACYFLALEIEARCAFR